MAERDLSGIATTPEVAGQVLHSLLTTLPVGVLGAASAWHVAHWTMTDASLAGAAVLDWGLPILTVIVASGWKGGQLAYRHRVGMLPDEASR
jgi:uncharacterized membrane protein